MFRKIVKYTALIINLFFILIYVFALLAPIVPSTKFVFFSYFGLAFPVLIIIQIVFVLFWLFRRKWLFLLSLSVLVLSLPAINNTFTFPFHAKPNIDKNKPIIKLLSYNISIFNSEKSYDEIMNFITETNADVVCLQEFGFYNKNSRLSAPEILAQFRKLYPYRHLWYKNQSGRVSWGVATFSKYPIIQKQKVEYTSNYNVSIYSDIALGQDTVRLFNNHLESNKFTMGDVKQYKSLTENPNRKNLLNITELFSTKLNSAYRIRAIQAETVANEVKKAPYNVIVCGDFNDVPQSYTYRTIQQQGLCDVTTATNWGYNHTFHTNRMLVNIYHVLVSKNTITPIDTKIIKQPFFDHYPVITEWQVK